MLLMALHILTTPACLLTDPSAKDKPENIVLRLETPLPPIPQSHYYYTVRGEYYFIWPDSLKSLMPRNDSGKDLFMKRTRYLDPGIRFDDIDISIDYFTRDSLEVAAKRFAFITRNPSHIDTSYIIVNGQLDTLYCIESKNRCGSIQLTDPPCKLYWILIPNCPGCEVTAATNATDSLSRARIFDLAVSVAYSIRFTPP